MFGSIQSRFRLRANARSLHLRSALDGAAAQAAPAGPLAQRPRLLCRHEEVARRRLPPRICRLLDPKPDAHRARAPIPVAPELVGPRRRAAQQRGRPDRRGRPRGRRAAPRPRDARGRGGAAPALPTQCRALARVRSRAVERARSPRPTGRARGLDTGARAAVRSSTRYELDGMRMYSDL